jgi:hypothetical protein
MREDADRIYQDKTTLVVRPQSEDASCYYGQGTKWCISATKGQNYWNSYTDEQGAVFFFILDKEVAKKADDDRDDHDSRYENAGKIAFVYNGDHLDAAKAWDAYDEVDDQVDGDIGFWYEETWGTEKTQTIIDAIQESIDEEPPAAGFDLEAAVEELREYAGSLEGFVWSNDEGGVSVTIDFNEWDEYPSIEASGQVTLWFDGYDEERDVGEEEIDDFEQLHSDVLEALHNNGNLPLSGFSAEKADLAAFAQTLEHFQVNTDESTVITFDYAQEKKPNWVARPRLGDKTEVDVSQLSDFSAEKILQQIDARAQEFAKQQMSLNFGDKYDTSTAPAPTFPKHNFSVALKKNADKEVFLHLKVAIAKSDSVEEKELAKNYLTYLNDNYDTIIKAFSEELQSSIAGAE